MAFCVFDLGIGLEMRIKLIKFWVHNNDFRYLKVIIVQNLY